MKKTTLNLWLFLILLSSSNWLQALPYGTGNVGSKKGAIKKANPNSEKKFKRLYSSYQINRSHGNEKKADGISITFEDFSSHLEIGRQRQVVFLPNTLTMNIGKINSGLKETWILPDFSNLSGVIEDVQYQIAPEETDIFEIFGYGTHAFYADNNLERDDLYDLQTDKLTFVGYEEVVEGGDYNNDDDWEEFKYDQLRAAIPLELGLDYSSVVKFEEEGNPTNYIEYTDSYTVIGEGTLKTYDDGDADALKAIYKEETRTFENNVEVSYSERYEIVFYSKRGHYIYAEIEDPNSEGEVNISNIVYHKVIEKTASVNDALISDVKVFPNPINAGETLTIQSQISLENNVVEVFTINGQKVSTLQFTKTKNNQYQTSVPEKLASGIYFYKIHDQKGGFLKNGKIQIQ